MPKTLFVGTICNENGEKICKIGALLTQDNTFEKVFLAPTNQILPIERSDFCEMPMGGTLVAKIIENRFCGLEKNVPLLPFAKTKFYETVYESLFALAYGQTVSYQELAKVCGNEKAARAVGNAMRNNPLPIIYPCHRVVGKNGGLCGFAGKGEDFIKIKEKLLLTEKQNERIKVI